MFECVWTLLCTLLRWATCALLLLVTIAVLDILHLSRSRFHTWRSLLYMYAMYRVRTLLGRYFWLREGSGLDRLRQAQEQLVLKLVHRSADSDYGRDHNFAQIHSLEDFRRLHPVIDYDHVKPYIDRVMNGEVTALYPKTEKVVCYFCSSGTTGASKHIPSTEGGSKMMLKSLFGCIVGMGDQLINPDNLQKAMTITCAPRWRHTSTGVKIGPASGQGAQDPKFANGNSTPAEAVIIYTEAEAYHVGMVLALRDRELARWEAGFTFGLWTQLQFLEQNWRQIVADIRTGLLCGTLNISDEQRRVINAMLSPQPQRADELEREFQKGMQDIVPRLFPHMTHISALSSGISMAQYRDKVTPYIGNLQIHSAIHGASEGIFGLNVRPPSQPPAYALLPGCTFVEFLPVNESGDSAPGAQPLMADEVTIGNLYEVVITNTNGLYRYRLGDVVKIVGTYQQSPTYDFVFRRSQLLNVHMEKVSEAAFTGALSKAADGWQDHELIDFTTAESVLDPAAEGSGAAPYYLVFVELRGPEISANQLGDIDASLQLNHDVFKSFRVKNSIGAMRVVRVKEGTFAAFRHHVIATTQTALSQFKQARVLRTDQQVQFFLERAQ